MINIVYDVMFNKMNHQDTAKKYRIKPRLVSDLLVKVKENNQFFKEVRDKKEKKEHIKELIAQRIKSFNKNDIAIESAK